MEPEKDARDEAVRRGVGGYERHILLCTGPDCEGWDTVTVTLGEELK